MADHKPLPVAGYTAQNDEKIALANELKAAEERYLRILDKLNGLPWTDKRNIAMARSAMEDANMRAVRSIFQPTRIALPDDAAPAKGDVRFDVT